MPRRSCCSAPSSRRCTHARAARTWCRAEMPSKCRQRFWQERARRVQSARVGKKDQKKTPGDGVNKLSHNPFASLQGKLELPPGGAAAVPVEQLTAQPAVPTNRKRGRLVQRRETKHRAGKAVI